MKAILPALLAACWSTLAAAQGSACLPGGAGLQEQGGAVSCDGGTVVARAGPRDGRVAKAALIVPFERAPAGSVVTVSARFRFPADSPLDSIHLMDIECKRCGIDGNPGLRLYLRDGRLRVDRAKIDGGHAWTNDAAPRVPRGEWVRIAWRLRLGEAGRSSVRLGGVRVLDDRGRTVPGAPPADAVDRVQIGITASSNAVPVALEMRDIRVRVVRPD